MKRNIFHLRNVEILIFCVVLLLIPLTFGKIFLPSQTMFDFHDSSQAPRVAEFGYNLKTLHIPPRIAPHWSFELGFPVFTYYAPFSYWLTTFISFIFSIPNSIKLSFLLAILVAFSGMFLLIKKQLNTPAALLGAAFYASSPYLAVETLIRGNLGEIWYLALLPWAFYAVIRLSDSPSIYRLLFAACTLSFLFSVHNVLSLVSIPLFTLLMLLLPQKRWTMGSLIMSVGLSAYFFVPALIELPLTHAREIAKNTYYADHFLCLSQLWYSAWGYGGSVAGCTQDGMSFMLGKIQIILGVIGIIIFFAVSINKKKIDIVPLFIFIVALAATFLTTYSSAKVWEVFAPILSLFQFPWRLLIFSLFGISFFAAYSIYLFPKKVNIFLVAVCIVYAFFNGSKFFQKIQMPIESYQKEYLSDAYVKTRVAYKIPEYLPQSVDYKYWLKYEPNAQNTQYIDQTLMKEEFVHPLFPGSYIEKNTPYFKSASLTPGVYTVNIHNFPNWKVQLDGRTLTKYTYDRLGRPMLILSHPSKLEVVYKQTLVQQLSNAITAISLMICALLVIPRINQAVSNLIQYSYEKRKKHA